MDDEIKKTPDDLVNDNSSDQENDSKPKESEDLSQPKGESNTEHRVIHKKNDKLHIYVRQDKYKGELKSKNWVGRTYINGKQKVSSSGTTNLDEAIPILEKWFDDLQTQADDNTENAENNKKILKNIEPAQANIDEASTNILNDKQEEASLKSSMFEKLKNIKIGKSKNNNNSTPQAKDKDR